MAFKLQVNKTWRSLAALTCVASFALAGCGSASTLDLKTGDCFNLPEDVVASSGGEVKSVDIVECSEEHTAEVVSIHELDFDEFPGSEAIQQVAEKDCVESFESYVGIPLSESAVDLYPLMPTEESWNKANDRRLACIAMSSAGTMTESLKSTSE